MFNVNLSKHISIIILASFFFLLVLGLNMTMQMNDDGSMSDCPFMEQASLCQMSVFEHIAKFQSIFAAAVQNNLIAFLAAIIIAIFSIIVGYLLFVPAPPKQLVYASDQPQGITFNKILLALSDGIIQPKLFA